MVERFTDLDGVIAVGSFPAGVEDIQTLAGEHGITGLVSLQSDADLASRGLRWSTVWQLCLGEGITATRVPIVDFDKRDLLRHLDAAVEAIDAHVSAGRKLYVHCTAGLNRSPSAVIAWVARTRGLSATAAAAWLGERHAAQPYMDVLKKWARRARVPFKG